jgi:hypothetical protein
MRISIPPEGPPQPQGSLFGASATGPSFEDIMNQRRAGERGSAEPALGFAEPGVMGAMGAGDRARAVSVKEANPPSLAMGRLNGAPSADITDPKWNSDLTARLSTSIRSAVDGIQRPSTDAPHAGRFMDASSSADGAGSGTPAQGTLRGRTGAVGSARTATAAQVRVKAALRRQVTPFSLFVSKPDADGQVAVAIRGLGVQSAATGIRKAVVSILAEFGVSLSDLALNGEFLPDPPALQEVKHGNRAR